MSGSPLSRHSDEFSLVESSEGSEYCLSAASSDEDGETLVLNRRQRYGSVATSNAAENPSSADSESSEPADTNVDEILGGNVQGFTQPVVGLFLTSIPSKATGGPAQDGHALDTTTTGQNVHALGSTGSASFSPGPVPSSPDTNLPNSGSIKETLQAQEAHALEGSGQASSLGVLLRKWWKPDALSGSRDLPTVTLSIEEAAGDAVGASAGVGCAAASTCLTQDGLHITSATGSLKQSALAESTTCGAVVQAGGVPLPMLASVPGSSKSHAGALSGPQAALVCSSESALQAGEGPAHGLVATQTLDACSSLRLPSSSGAVPSEELSSKADAGMHPARLIGSHDEGLALEDGQAEQTLHGQLPAHQEENETPKEEEGKEEEEEEEGLGGSCMLLERDAVVRLAAQALDQPQDPRGRRVVSEDGATGDSDMVIDVGQPVDAAQRIMELEEERDSLAERLLEADAARTELESRYGQLSRAYQQQSALLKQVLDQQLNTGSSASSNLTSRAPSPSQSQHQTNTEEAGCNHRGRSNAHDSSSASGSSRRAQRKHAGGRQDGGDTGRNMPIGALARGSSGNADVEDVWGEEVMHRRSFDPACEDSGDGYEEGEEAEEEGGGVLGMRAPGSRGMQQLGRPLAAALLVCIIALPSLCVAVVCGAADVARACASGLTAATAATAAAVPRQQDQNQDQEEAEQEHSAAAAALGNTTVSDMFSSASGSVQQAGAAITPEKSSRSAPAPVQPAGGAASSATAAAPALPPRRGPRTCVLLTRSHRLIAALLLVCVLLACLNITVVFVACHSRGSGRGLMGGWCSRARAPAHMQDWHDTAVRHIKYGSLPLYHLDEARYSRQYNDAVPAHDHANIAHGHDNQHAIGGALPAASARPACSQPSPSAARVASAATARVAAVGRPASGDAAGTVARQRQRHGRGYGYGHGMLRSAPAGGGVQVVVRPVEPLPARPAPAHRTERTAPATATATRDAAAATAAVQLPAHAPGAVSTAAAMPEQLMTPGAAPSAPWRQDGTAGGPGAAAQLPEKCMATCNALSAAHAQYAANGRDQAAQCSLTPAPHPAAAPLALPAAAAAPCVLALPYNWTWGTNPTIHTGPIFLPLDVSVVVTDRHDVPNDKPRTKTPPAAALAPAAAALPGTGAMTRSTSAHTPLIPPPHAAAAAAAGGNGMAACLPPAPAVAALPASQRPQPIPLPPSPCEPVALLPHGSAPDSVAGDAVPRTSSPHDVPNPVAAAADHARLLGAQPPPVALPPAQQALASMPMLAVAAPAPLLPAAPGPLPPAAPALHNSSGAVDASTTAGSRLSSRCPKHQPHAAAPMRIAAFGASNSTGIANATGSCLAAARAARRQKAWRPTCYVLLRDYILHSLLGIKAPPMRFHVRQPDTAEGSDMRAGARATTAPSNHAAPCSLSSLTPSCGSVSPRNITCGRERAQRPTCYVLLKDYILNALMGVKAPPMRFHLHHPLPAAGRTGLAGASSGHGRQRGASSFMSQSCPGRCHRQAHRQRLGVASGVAGWVPAVEGLAQLLMGNRTRLAALPAAAAAVRTAKMWAKEAKAALMPAASQAANALRALHEGSGSGSASAAAGLLALAGSNAKTITHAVAVRSADLMHKALAAAPHAGRLLQAMQRAEHPTRDHSAAHQQQQQQVPSCCPLKCTSFSSSSMVHDDAPAAGHQRHLANGGHADTASRATAGSAVTAVAQSTAVAVSNPAHAVSGTVRVELSCMAVTAAAAAERARQALAPVASGWLDAAHKVATSLLPAPSLNTSTSAATSVPATNAEATIALTSVVAVAPEQVTQHPAALSASLPAASPPTAPDTLLAAASAAVAVLPNAAHAVEQSALLDSPGGSCAAVSAAVPEGSGGTCAADVGAGAGPAASATTADSNGSVGSSTGHAGGDDDARVAEASGTDSGSGAGASLTLLEGDSSAARYTDNNAMMQALEHSSIGALVRAQKYTLHSWYVNTPALDVVEGLKAALDNATLTLRAAEDTRVVAAVAAGSGQQPGKGGCDGSTRCGKRGHGCGDGCSSKAAKRGSSRGDAGSACGRGKGGRGRAGKCGDTQPAPTAQADRLLAQLLMRVAGDPHAVAAELLSSLKGRVRHDVWRQAEALLSGALSGVAHQAAQQQAARHVWLEDMSTQVAAVDRRVRALDAIVQEADQNLTRVIRQVATSPATSYPCHSADPKGCSSRVASIDTAEAEAALAAGARTMLAVYSALLPAQHTSDWLYSETEKLRQQGPGGREHYNSVEASLECLHLQEVRLRQAAQVVCGALCDYRRYKLRDAVKALEQSGVAHMCQCGAQRAAPASSGPNSVAQLQLEVMMDDECHQQQQDNTRSGRCLEHRCSLGDALSVLAMPAPSSSLSSGGSGSQGHDADDGGDGGRPQGDQERKRSRHDHRRGRNAKSNKDREGSGRKECNGRTCKDKGTSRKDRRQAHKDGARALTKEAHAAAERAIALQEVAGVLARVAEVLPAAATEADAAAVAAVPGSTQPVIEGALTLMHRFHKWRLYVNAAMRGLEGAAAALSGHDDDGYA